MSLHYQDIAALLPASTLILYSFFLVERIQENKIRYLILMAPWLILIYQILLLTSFPHGIAINLDTVMLIYAFMIMSLKMNSESGRKLQ